MEGFIVRSLLLILCTASIARAQRPEAIVSKDELSVHRVERGTMPLREAVTGSIVAIAPGRASVVLTAKQTTVVRTGQRCLIQIVPPTVLSGTVGLLKQDAQGATLAAIDISDTLAQGTAIGARVDALIEVGSASDILFFERPANAQPNTTSIIFVIEADGEHAKRVTVRYGRRSGALLEILNGLAPGDRVIVTDMSKWAGYDRVRLQ